MRYIFVLALTLLASSAFAQEMCEVILPDGTVALVSCCEIKLDSEPASGCAGIARASKGAAVEALQQALNKIRLKRVARFLRKNPDSGISYIAIEQPPIVGLTAFCCDCNPAQITCNGSVNECSGPDSKGQCPAGSSRWLCTDGGGQDCTGLD